MTFKLIDTHTHAHFAAYKNDMDEVVKRSLEEGIAMITVGTQSTTSENAVKLAERYEGVWATIGLHPNHLHAQEFYDQDELPPEEQGTDKIKTRSERFDLEFYQKLAEHPKVVAVGEFGLDYYRLPPEVDRERMIADQKAECQQQLDFADKIGKPIVIHSRDAFEDQYHILKENIAAGKLARRGVIHSFTGTVEEAKAYQDLGFLISLNGILTFSKELQDQVKQIPLEQIMLETDAPYLAPPPHRGERNEPRYVKFIGEKLAEIKSVSLEEVAAETNQNAERLFNISL